MSEVQNLIQLLTGDKERQLVDVKFFPGTDPDLTDEDLAREVISAKGQIKLGNAELVSDEILSGGQQRSLNDLTSVLNS